MWFKDCLFIAIGVKYSRNTESYFFEREIYMTKDIEFTCARFKEGEAIYGVVAEVWGFERLFRSHAEERDSASVEYSGVRFISDNKPCCFHSILH